MKTTMERLIAENYKNKEVVTHIIRNVDFKRFKDVVVIVNMLCPDVRVEKNKIHVWNDNKMQWEKINPQIK